MDKLKLETPNITELNIERIEEIFPNVITEGTDKEGRLKKVVDFEKLKQELSDYIMDGEESYDFTWVGKKEAMLEANRPIRKTLRPDRNSSVNWEDTQNIYIEGDNLDALKLLQESYLGKIKMIYIDPPYNTGKDYFPYKDKFSMTEDEYKESIEYKNEEGYRVICNPDTNPRFHSVWCSIIYSRLKLARNLLTDDGVIFISIDDHEIKDLKNICDEIFGPDNFVAIIPRTTSFQRSGQEKYMNISHDYLLCYCRPGCLDFYNVTERTIDPDLIQEDKNGHYIKGDTKAILAASSQGYSKGGDYDFEYNGKIYSPVDSKGNRNRWLWTKDRMQAAADLGILVETPTTLRMQVYLDKVFEVGTNKLIPKNNDLKFHTADFMAQDFDNAKGSIELKQLFEGKDIFRNPKPVTLLKYLSNMCVNKDDIILDFFSGSGTTAHAIMELNAQDNGNRKYIMVQLPELISETSEAYKAGYKNICEIGKERIRRAGNEIKNNNPNTDIGFRVFKVDDTNMNDVYYAPKDYNKSLLDQLTSNIKDGRTDEDLLYGVLLHWGIELSLPHKIEKIDGKKVHIVNDNELGADLIACFEENISENIVREIAKKKPTRVVFRDSSFTADEHKINVEEIFKMITPNTTVKVI